MSFSNNASRILFAASGAASVASSAYLFRDLADLSQWVLHVDRSEVFETFRNRHKLATFSAGSIALNACATFVMKPKKAIPLPVWAAVNGASLLMLYSGYANPEIMMRPRNTNAVFVPSSNVLQHLQRNETVIVTRGLEGKVYAFPDTQILRPHVVRLPGRKGGGSQRIMTYCGLTNLGLVFDIAKDKDGKEVELVPVTQLENNLVLMDKTSGHVGQQINGIDENTLKEKKGAKNFEETKRRPSHKELCNLDLHGSEMGSEVPSWRMSLGDFVRTYPKGEVFLNDYKMFKDVKAPIKTLYDTIMDTIFETSIKFQATNPKPVFPTLENIDPRLPSKEPVWAWNVEDDYVALTEDFVRDGENGVRNLKVGGQDIVASWDPNSGSLGIFKNDTGRSIRSVVDVNGEVATEKIQLERIHSVKNGAYWCVVANFFPQIRVNPAC